MIARVRHEDGLNALCEQDQTDNDSHLNAN